MLVHPDGSIVGTVGGGAIEQATIEHARAVLDTGVPELFKAHLTRDLAMCCGGRMEVFIDPIGHEPTLLVFGGGHVGAALVEVATQAGFAVTVVDGRDGFCTAERHPRARHLLPLPPLEALDDLPWGPTCYAVIVTHDHRTDEELLLRCLDRPRAYLGMIGSRAKVHRFWRRYEARGIPASDLADVRTPIGLDIQAREPGEIAVAIVAELIAVRRGASASITPLQLDLASIPVGAPPDGAGH